MLNDLGYNVNAARLVPRVQIASKHGEGGGRGGEETGYSVARMLKDACRGENSVTRQAACRDLLSITRAFGAGLAAKLLRHLARGAASLPIADIAEDAAQHVALRAVEGRVTACAMSNDELAVAWCRRVFSNFVLDEVRLFRKRVVQMPPVVQASASIEEQISWKRDTRRFVAALRAEAALSARARNREERVRLIDELFSSLLSPVGGVAMETSARTVAKRMTRARRLAADVWRTLRGRMPRARDLDHIASALGLACIEQKMEVECLQAMSSSVLL